MRQKARLVVILSCGIIAFTILSGLVYTETHSMDRVVSRVLDTTGHLGILKTNASTFLAGIEISNNCLTLRRTLLGVPELMTSQMCKTCDKYTCETLLSNVTNPHVYPGVVRWMERRDHKIKLVKKRKVILHFGLMEKMDCDDYVTKVGYQTSPPDKEETDFPIAYNILIFKHTEQLEILLKAIYRSHNTYCIHVDAKSDAEFHNTVQAIAKCFPNVFIASVLENVTYAGFSRLQADINCMTDQVRRPEKWKYLINIASQAFPIKSNQEMVRILKLFNGSNDIEGVVPTAWMKERFENEHIENKTSNEIVRTGRKNPPPPHRIKIIKGSAYGTFSRAFVEFLLSDQKAKDLLEWSKTTMTPDEHYWATLNHLHSNPQLNTPGGYHGHPHSKPWLSSYSMWIDDGKQRCKGQWVRRVCMFGVGDLPLATRQKHLFINKLDVYYQPIALQCLGKWIEYKSLCPQTFDLEYYRSLPFV